MLATHLLLTWTALQCRSIPCELAVWLLQDMLASWSQPFRDSYGIQNGAHYYELSFVESAVSQVTSPVSILCALVVMRDAANTLQLIN